MEKSEYRFFEKKLYPGTNYWDKVNKEVVEFGYLGQTGLAIVYEPGDSGGGSQSSWGIHPSNLEEITKDASSRKK